jgi:hypothetical protein
MTKQMDLSRVKRTLKNKKGWTEERCEEVCQEYLRFLALVQLRPCHMVVPPPLVDEVWHEHILMTAQYREDCQRIFGHFLDHDGGVGTRGAEDLLALKSAWAQTLVLYRTHFGPPPLEIWSDAEKCGAPNLPPSDSHRFFAQA